MNHFKTFSLSLLLAVFFTSQVSAANATLPIKGTVISPADPHIQYLGRISFTNP